MQSYHIIRESKIPETFRTQSVKSQFDIQGDILREEFRGNIDISGDWNIGLIVGPSGTGKSTIAKELFSEYFTQEGTFDTTIPVVEAMPKNKSIKDIIGIFSNVGFSSPPSWLKPYNVLSNGEKMRVDLAHALLLEKDITIFDEFTSVVDRTVAQVGSFCVQKNIRKFNKKFIAVSCHADIEEWLMPDWVLYTESMTFVKKKPQSDQISHVHSLDVPVPEVNNYGTFLKNIII